MARRRIGDPDLRPLVDRLARLFLEEGSVNAVQRRLADELADDRSEGYIHANRIHTILGEDPDKSINPSTLEAIETAVDRLPAASVTAGPVEDKLRAEVATRWVDAESESPLTATNERAQSIGNAIGAPAAVVRLLAEKLHPVPAEPVVQRVTAGNDQGGSPAPDWSFQDEASERCVALLQARPDAKIGLVLPTGGGKTRVAIRILLQILAHSKSSNSTVVWVTHRRHLRNQASRELQRATVSGTPDLPPRAAALLADRVEFCMVGKLGETLERLGSDVALVVVDEAHHAAAVSYQPIFEAPGLRGLFLTATPNRTDGLSIGVDQIAYSTTYRDLFDRGVVVEPKLEQITIDGFDWSIEATVEELADYLLEEASDTFAKTLVAVSRLVNAGALREALLRRLPSDHVLAEDDIVSVGGGQTSNGLDVQTFLDEFGSKPRGILIATSQLLGEGFDDPSVDTAVVTYSTSSIVDLMQVAGRCMRYAPGKTAHVIQVRDSALAYHWEQGWLYQDIADVLRPRLETVPYAGPDDLAASIREILDHHNVDPVVADAIAADAAEATPGDTYSMLLTGLPYYGRRENFDQDAAWSAIFVTPPDRHEFLRVFNAFSAENAYVKDRKTFLEKYLPVDPSRGSKWTRHIDMLAAMSAAGAELRAERTSSTNSRPANFEHGTSYLKYFTFEFQPVVPAMLDSFLSDAVNRDELITRFLQDPERWEMAAKAPLPLGGSRACLLPAEGAAWAVEQRHALKARLQDADRAVGFEVVAAWRAGLDDGGNWPQFLLDRFELLVSGAGWGSLTVEL
jgi:superfamily II DNA or RNA helicase